MGRNIRICSLILVALLLLVACQWGGAAKLPAASNAASSGPAARNPPGGSDLDSSGASTPNGDTQPASIALEGATATPIKFTDADFAKHVEQLKARIKKSLTPAVGGAARGGRRAPVPSPAQFSIVIQAPFVVIGDETKQEVERHGEGTVKWAVERLKQDFFHNDPTEILDIWLFKDKESYEKHTLALFGDTPTTPYGYYSSTHKALIMNIETGGGTLVHEIVHPFMEANFPDCPPWLNEGLGSLYEQCGDVKGHIYGYTNWRLPGLQQAIRSSRVPSFKSLMEMDANAFYNADKGTNYGQARYLCYYLQEKGVLVKFYQEFHAHQKEDPSGFNTLKKVLAETDMDAFKTKWEKYVLTLRRGFTVTVE
jgi:hypothetical protein